MHVVCLSFCDDDNMTILLPSMCSNWITKTKSYILFWRFIWFASLMSTFVQLCFCDEIKADFCIHTFIFLVYKKGYCCIILFNTIRFKLKSGRETKTLIWKSYSTILSKYGPRNEKIRLIVILMFNVGSTCIETAQMIFCSFTGICSNGSILLLR